MLPFSSPYPPRIQLFHYIINLFISDMYRPRIEGFGVPEKSPSSGREYHVGLSMELNGQPTIVPDICSTDEDFGWKSLCRMKNISVHSSLIPSATKRDYRGPKLPDLMIRAISTPEEMFEKVSFLNRPSPFEQNKAIKRIQTWN